MEIDPQTIPWQSLYKLLIGAVIPRPIGWISSVDAAGIPNLAPFSFFTVVCANPPTVVFCPMVRSSDASPKDTLRNVRTCGEFVVNIVTEELANAMNRTSAELPPGANEFNYAGLEQLTSVMVRPPRVALSQIHSECRVSHIIDLGSQPGAGSLVLGEIVYVHLRDEIMLGSDKIDPLKLKPIARLAGNAYCRITDLFELERPASALQR